MSESALSECSEARPARSAYNSLKALRHDVRYSLWGLDKGLRVLSRLPDWIGHAKNSPETAEEIYGLANDLAETLDGVILKVYLYGSEPSFWQKVSVNRKAAALRARYDLFSGEHEPDITIE
jgi:hypothetical protein